MYVPGSAPLRRASGTGTGGDAQGVYGPAAHLFTYYCADFFNPAYPLLLPVLHSKHQPLGDFSDYKIINQSEKVKNHKEIYTRNIITGVTPKNSREEEYTGIYNQKIKALY